MILIASLAAQRIGLQLQRTALTVNAEAQPPDFKRLPNIGWLVRCGVSCSALGGTPRAPGIE
jgi:hypothetical protein